MTKYIKCPRCELNYIPDNQDYCDVCKAELNIGGIKLLEDEDEILCPKCKRNYLEIGEKICSMCANKLLAVDSDKDSTIFDDPDLTSLGELEEEEWETNEGDKYDDDEGFGNTADFVDEEEPVFDDVFIDDIVDDTEFIDDDELEELDEVIEETIEEDDFDFDDFNADDFDEDDDGEYDEDEDFEDEDDEDLDK